MAMAKLLPKKIITPENAMIRLQELCVRAEHCSHELRDKLYRWGVASDDAERIMQELKKYKFVDDSRFAAAYVRDKALYNRWGRRKIAAALVTKRIDRTIINDALEAIDNDAYRTVLFEFMKAKCRSIKEGNSYDGRTKLFRAAALRGYEAELISDIIRNHNAELWDGGQIC